MACGGFFLLVLPFENPAFSTLTCAHITENPNQNTVNCEIKEFSFLGVKTQYLSISNVQKADLKLVSTAPENKEKDRGYTPVLINDQTALDFGILPVKLDEEISQLFDLGNRVNTFIADLSIPTFSTKDDLRSTFNIHIDSECIL